MADSPKLFRVILQVADLTKAVEFYSKLRGIEGRILRGSRAYFDCGPVILAILDTTTGGVTPRPGVEYIYFAVADLETVHTTARDLGCLSDDQVHDQTAGAIVVRPWGERSFYAEDPWGNGLCFVDENTLYTGY